MVVYLSVDAAYLGVLAAFWTMVFLTEKCVYSFYECCIDNQGHNQVGGKNFFSFTFFPLYTPTFITVQRDTFSVGVAKDFQRVISYFFTIKWKGTI